MPNWVSALDLMDLPKQFHVNIAPRRNFLAKICIFLAKICSLVVFLTFGVNKHVAVKLSVALVFLDTPLTPNRAPKSGVKAVSDRGARSAWLDWRPEKAGKSGCRAPCPDLWVNFPTVLASLQLSGPPTGDRGHGRCHRLLARDIGCCSRWYPELSNRVMNWLLTDLTTLQ
jgi:hypothetical protein